MKLKYQVVDIEDIISFWVKEYKFKKGEKLFQNKYYYDPSKGKVILELSISEPDD